MRTSPSRQLRTQTYRPPHQRPRLVRETHVPVQIWVFHDPNDTDCISAHCLTVLQAYGYEPYVDSLHQKDQAWCQQAFHRAPHRFFHMRPPRTYWHVDDTRSSFTNHTTEAQDATMVPDMVVFYLDEVVLSEHDWDKIAEFFLSLFDAADRLTLPRPPWTRFMSKYLSPPHKPVPINTPSPPPFSSSAPSTASADSTSAPPVLDLVVGDTRISPHDVSAVHFSPRAYPETRRHGQ